MTQKQIEELSVTERDNFMKVFCRSFHECLSLEEYIEAVRDYTYIWRFIDEGYKRYTFDYVTKHVKSEIPAITRSYEDQWPIDDAAIDADYCCG